MRGKGKLGYVTFDLTSPKDVLEKFAREVERFQTAPSRESAGDHIINAFTTGWHLHEWVWDAIRDNPTLTATVLSKLGPANKIEKSQQFGAALARKHQFLEICRIVATSAKHVHVALEEDSPQSVEAAFSLSSSTVTAIGTHPIAAPRTKWVAKLRIEDESVPVASILAQVDSFWVELIYGCGIEARA